MNVLSFVLISFILVSCNSGGKSTSKTTSSNLCAEQSSTTKTSKAICDHNLQVENHCQRIRSSCVSDCVRDIQRGISGGVAAAAMNQCERSCNSVLSVCLYNNNYYEGTDCSQAAQQPIDPNCASSASAENAANFVVDLTTGGSTASNGALPDNSLGFSNATIGGFDGINVTTTGGQDPINGTTTGGAEVSIGNISGGSTTSDQELVIGSSVGGSSGNNQDIDKSSKLETIFSGLWQDLPLTGSDLSKQAPSPRRHQTAVWTGMEMIIWGGAENYTYQRNLTTRNTNTGGRYNPTSNSWINLPNSSSFVPTTRDGHTAVWTGAEMIIWGGNQDVQHISSGWTDGGPTNTGSTYNPSDNTWLPTSITGGPAGRFHHTAVWSGSEMIVWGGRTSSGTTNSGSRYQPHNFKWTELPHPSISGAPSARSQHSAVWTGSEMIVWGGTENNGSTGMNTGGRYNPSKNTWTPTSTEGAPSGRYGHTAIWTGSEMIVWGGNGRTGGKYNPTTDKWSALPTLNSPFGRGHIAIWTGTEMIVWGGSENQDGNLVYSNSGAIYNPNANEWTLLPVAGSIVGRTAHSLVWTGTEIIVWGGGNMATGVFVNTGAKLKR